MVLILSDFDSSYERDMRSHLHLAHGTYVYDVKTVEGLIECHTEQHKDPDTMFHVKHEHGEQAVIEEVLETWDW